VREKDSVLATGKLLAPKRFVSIDSRKNIRHGRRRGVDRSDPASSLAFLDQLPELLRLGEIFVISDGKIGPIEKVLEGVPAQDPVNDD
jgi:hypothetical protein